MLTDLFSRGFIFSGRALRLDELHAKITFEFFGGLERVVAKLAAQMRDLVFAPFLEWIGPAAKVLERMPELVLRLRGLVDLFVGDFDLGARVGDLGVELVEADAEFLETPIEMVLGLSTLGVGEFAAEGLHFGSERLELLHAMPEIADFAAELVGFGLGVFGIHVVLLCVAVDFVAKGLGVRLEESLDGLMNQISHGLGLLLPILAISFHLLFESSNFGLEFGIFLRKSSVVVSSVLLHCRDELTEGGDLVVDGGDLQGRGVDAIVQGLVLAFDALGSFLLHRKFGCSSVDRINFVLSSLGG